MSGKNWESYLKTFVNYESQPWAHDQRLFRLDRVHALLQTAGRPQLQLKIVHVAGTKGKGSTCAFTAHILRRAGYRVGLYTSPHLEQARERIRVLDPLDAERDAAWGWTGCISEAQCRDLLAESEPALEDFRDHPGLGRLTYFEVLTFLAFCHFVRQRVDVAVIETGLGGRLDATNVGDPWAYGLTPVSIDHVQQLGPRLVDIAREKVAIIKDPPRPSSVAVVAPQDPAVEALIVDHCRQRGVAVFKVGQDIRIEDVTPRPDGQTFRVQGRHGTYPLATRLLGRHQAVNAATAVGLAEALMEQGLPVRPEAFPQGAAETFWPGRFERISRCPLIIVDGAHNPESMRILKETVKDHYPDKRVLVVLAVSADKDLRGIAGHLQGLASRIILTRSRHPRSRAWGDQDPEVFAPTPCEMTDQVAVALDRALREAGPDDMILVTGSIFAVAEARALLATKHREQAALFPAAQPPGGAPEDLR